MTKVRLDSPSPAALEAIREGVIDGDEYRDGEVWIDYPSYQRWLDSQPAIRLAPEEPLSH